LSLNDRIEALARDLARRESSHQEAIEKAQRKAAELHRQVEAAIARFNAVVGLSIPYLEVWVSAPRVDDKHLHAVEFNLERGRHRAIVTVKSKGEITLVGPFRSGKTEGPCRSFAFAAEAEFQDALAEFLERFLEEAAAP
jgi:hypothetical protein